MPKLTVVAIGDESDVPDELIEATLSRVYGGDDYRVVRVERALLPPVSVDGTLPDYTEFIRKYNLAADVLVQIKEQMKDHNLYVRFKLVREMLTLHLSQKYPFFNPDSRSLIIVRCPEEEGLELAHQAAQMEMLRKIFPYSTHQWV